jgi:hypothetical protein
MKFIHACLLFCALASAGAQSDIYKIASDDPKQQVYAAVIPIFDTDPQNENPYRIAIRDKESGKIWGSDISWIDMVTKDSVQETSVIWSPSGDFVVFQMKPDRRSQMIRTYYIDRQHQRIREVEMPDYVQNMLGRLDRVSMPDSSLGETVTFTSKDILTIEVGGARPALSGKASVKLHGDPHSDPRGELLSVEVDKGEQDAAANP